MNEIITLILEVLSIIGYFSAMCILEDIRYSKTVTVIQLILLIIFLPITLFMLFMYFILYLIHIFLHVLKIIDSYDFLILDFNKNRRKKDDNFKITNNSKPIWQSNNRL